MLDIILRTRRYDLGYVSDWGGLYSGYVNALRRGGTDFSSVWEANEVRARDRMERDIEVYRDLP
jgi:hypothetical protein